MKVLCHFFKQPHWKCQLAVLWQGEKFSQLYLPRIQPLCLLLGYAYTYCTDMPWERPSPGSSHSVQENIFLFLCFIMKKFYAKWFICSPRLIERSYRQHWTFSATASKWPRNFSTVINQRVFVFHTSKPCLPFRKTTIYSNCLLSSGVAVIQPKTALHILPWFQL